MSKAKLATLALILAIIIWSAGSPIFKWSLSGGLQPMHLAFFRFFIPLIILLPFLSRVQKIKPKDIIFVILLGLFDRVFNIGSYLLGLSYAPSINQAIIACSGPVFIILGSGLFLKEKVTKKMLLGNVIGLTGVLFIVMQPVMGVHASFALLGNSLFVISTMSAAVGALLTRKLAQKYSPITLLFWTFLIGTISFFPTIAPSLNTHTLISYLSFKSVIGIGFGALFSSLLAYLLFFWAMRYIPASQISIFTYMDPVVTALIAAPLLHEYPTVIFLLGAFLVFFGIFVAEGRLHYHPIHLLFKR